MSRGRGRGKEGEKRGREWKYREAKFEHYGENFHLTLYECWIGRNVWKFNTVYLQTLSWKGIKKRYTCHELFILLPGKKQQQKKMKKISLSFGKKKPGTEEGEKAREEEGKLCHKNLFLFSSGIFFPSSSTSTSIIISFEVFAVLFLLFKVLKIIQKISYSQHRKDDSFFFLRSAAFSSQNDVKENSLRDYDLILWLCRIFPH